MALEKKGIPQNVNHTLQGCKVTEDGQIFVSLDEMIKFFERFSFYTGGQFKWLFEDTRRRLTDEQKKQFLKIKTPKKSFFSRIFNKESK